MNPGRSSHLGRILAATLLGLALVHCPSRGFSDDKKGKDGYTPLPAGIGDLLVFDCRSGVYRSKLRAATHGRAITVRLIGVNTLIYEYGIKAEDVESHPQNVPPEFAAFVRA